MRKRHRKKRHIGEFTEWACELVIVRNSPDGIDDFLNDLIQVIQANDCFYGGAGGDDYKMQVTIDFGRGKNPKNSADRTNKIKNWLESRSDVEKWKFSKSYDSWHDQYPDLWDEI